MNVIKYSALSLSILASFCSPTVFADEPAPPPPITVSGGTLKFTGSLVNAPCTVEQSSEGMVVDLQQYRVADFQNIGDVSAAKQFEIKLGNCAVDTYKKAQVTFNGLTAEGNPHVLAVAAGASSARGIGLQILHAGKPVFVDNSAPSESTSLNPGETKLFFQAQYISTDAEVKPGKANASADFTVTYM